MRRFSESIKEHLRMYEGDSGAPKERFVTLEELEHVGLVTTKTQQGFASIDKLFGQQISTVPSAIPTSGSPGFGGGSSGVRTLRALDDTAVDGIKGGQGIVWNGNAFVPKNLPNFNLAEATRFDMMYFDGQNWRHTKQELQWNPIDNYLQLANAHAINWLDADDVSIELAVLEVGVVGDADFASVVLLTGVENTDGEGDQAFIVAVGGHTLTATEASTGVAEVQGAQAKFGSFSMFCDDAAGAVKARWGTTVNSTDFDFGSGDFTMECHLLFTRKSATDIPIFSKWIFNHFSFHWDFDSTLEKFQLVHSINGTSTAGGTAIAWPPDTYVTGRWYHMACAREGNTVRFFVDGTLCSTQQDVTGVTYFTGTQEFEIFSQDSNGAGDHATYIDNVRITKGVARYTANFTAPTAAFPTSADFAGFTLGDPSFDLYFDANEIRIRGVTTDNYLAIDHDNTDINLVGVNTTDINITDITALKMGTVDLDADDITATSYEAILAANILSRIKDESITGNWTWTGRLVTDDSTTSRAGFNIPIGVAPTSPAQGDVWSTATDLLMELTAGTETNAWISDVDALVFDDLFDIDLSGAADNDLLHRSGGDWIDTAGALTWDGSALKTTGIISLPAGTESLPSLAFTGDLDTGAYSPGANIYAITVGGTEAVRYTGSSAPFIQYGMAIGIIASTTKTQGQGLLTVSYNEVSVCANDDDTVTLPTALSGGVITIINNGVKRLKIFPSLGGDLGNGTDQPEFVKAGTSISYVASSATRWFNTDNEKTYRIGHTYAVIDKIKVPNGDKDFIVPFFVSLASGQTVKLVKARYKINAGTSVTCKLQKNGSNVTGFTGISVTTTAGETDPSDVTLADNDKLALVVTAISGVPKNMSFTIFLEYTQ